jgi:transcriptional regulator with XRE-family HTH domain
MAGRKTEEETAPVALGAFIRSHRERLAPHELGIARGVRRRTPGLRREEVAQRAGLSPTWYTWLEQGRRVSLSAHALARVASALNLSPAERRYLFELAQRLDPHHETPSTLSPALLETVHAVNSPAYLLDRQWTALAWNSAAATLFKGWLDARSAERNLLRYMFMSPAARALVDDWPHRAARLAAEFRAHSGPHLADPPMRALITQLESHSPDFRAFWRSQDVEERQGGIRIFRRGRGVARYQQTTFVPATAPGHLLVILVAVKKGAEAR